MALTGPAAPCGLVWATRTSDSGSRDTPDSGSDSDSEGPGSGPLSIFKVRLATAVGKVANYNQVLLAAAASLMVTVLRSLSLAGCSGPPAAAH